MSLPLIVISKELFAADCVRVEIGERFAVDQNQNRLVVFHGPDAHKRASEYANWMLEKYKERPAEAPQIS